MCNPLASLRLRARTALPARWLDIDHCLCLHTSKCCMFLRLFAHDTSRTTKLESQGPHKPETSQSYRLVLMFTHKVRVHRCVYRPTEYTHKVVHIRVTKRLYTRRVCTVVSARGVYTYTPLRPVYLQCSTSSTRDGGLVYLVCRNGGTTSCPD